MLKVSHRLYPEGGALEELGDGSPEGELGHIGRQGVRLNRSLDDLNLSTFDVGGSRKSAPIPVDVANRLEESRKELWGLQERSAKWQGHLKDLENAVKFRASLLDGEERKLDQVKVDKEELVDSLEQIRGEHNRASAELQTLRDSRIQQVEDNDFTRNAILEETRMLREEQATVERDLALLRTRKSAIKAFIEQSDATPEEEEVADSEEDGESQFSDAPQEVAPNSWLGGGRGMTVEDAHPTSTPGMPAGRARGRGRASLLDPRPGQDAGSSAMEAAFQEQLRLLQATQQQRVLQQQKELEAQQKEIWRQEQEALAQRKRDLAANAKLAQELAGAEAEQLRAKTLETKAAQQAASEKARKHQREVERLAEQQTQNQQMAALRAQCQYMSDAEKKWWFDQGVDPTKELVQYGRYQAYLATAGGSPPMPAAGPNPAAGPKPKPAPRRSRLSAGEEELYRHNPAIAGLGLHNIGATPDDTDVMKRCLKIAAGIRGSGHFARSGHGARRTASEPEAYFQKNSWEEYLVALVDEINYCGWDREESIPFLCKGLRKGDGLIAVEQWRHENGLDGNWMQLIETCTYLFASRGQHDPMAAFRKRVQGKQEPPRGFGLALMRLLKKVHPEWGLEHEIFAKELFTQFIGGLREADVQRVAYDAWTADCSLNDLFRAIENHSMKKTMLGDRVSHTISAAYEDPGEGVHSEEEDGDEAGVAAAQFKGTGKSAKPPWKGRSTEKGTPGVVATAPTPEKKTEGLDAAMFKTLMDKLTASLQSRSTGGTPRRRVDRKTAKCYRCLEIGHFAAECRAASPKSPEKEGN